MKTIKLLVFLTVFFLNATSFAKNYCEKFTIKEDPFTQDTKISIKLKEGKVSLWKKKKLFSFDLGLGFTFTGREAYGFRFLEPLKITCYQKKNSRILKIRKIISYKKDGYFHRRSALSALSFLIFRKFYVSYSFLKNIKSKRTLYCRVYFSGGIYDERPTSFSKEKINSLTYIKKNFKKIIKHCGVRD